MQAIECGDVVLVVILWCIQYHSNVLVLEIIFGSKSRRSVRRCSSSHYSLLLIQYVFTGQLYLAS